MPDLPPAKRQPCSFELCRTLPRQRYAELHCQTNFSFLRGASHPDELVNRAAELGYDALDWRPVLRQIRTRLIGEMSGYGGPNITTRAGTRKV